MSIPRFATAVLLIVVTAIYCSAFYFTIHSDITREALEALIPRLPSAWSPLLLVGFSGAAVKEITDANMAKDTNDCGDKFNANVPAKPCELAASETLSALEKVMETAHGDHFDAEYIQQGSNKLFAERNEIIRYMLDRNFVAARKILGGALHGIQDFYAHSNWVELQYGLTIDGRLGSDPKLNLFATPPRIATAGQATCKSGLTFLDHFYHPAGPSSVERDDQLTSGFFFLSLIDIDEVAKQGKCRHGWRVIPFGNQPGINKDDSSRPGYENARPLALLHSANFIIDLIRDTPSLKDDPTYTLGLMGHPTLISIDPPKVEVGQDVLLHLTGASFTVDNAKTKPTVLWNGKPLKTFSTVPPTSTKLDALLEKANVALPGTVRISVQQFDTDADGNVADTVLESNVVNFTVNGKEPDCPGDNTRAHSLGYKDVHATRWNDAGAVVEGVKVNIDVLDGTVVWRAGGLFVGPDRVSSPRGDATATPANTPLWVEPQIPISQVPIGGLIGMVVETKLLDKEGRPTIPLTEKPDGAKYFPIRMGGQFVPNVTGRLYLGINDGVFANNAGCFEVRVSGK